MRVVYIADDGKEFDDEFECEDYEWSLNHPRLNDIHIYDETDDELRDIFSEETYRCAEKIIVSDDETAKTLRDLGEYTGCCGYDGVTGPGKWIYDKKHSVFIKVGDA